MMLEQLFSQRLFNDPAQVQSESHRLLLRGGYIHELAHGVYALSPLGARVLRRLETIVREELDGLHGQEIRLPLVTQASLSAIKFNRSLLLDGTWCAPWRQMTAISIAPQRLPDHLSTATAGLFKGAPRGSDCPATSQQDKRSKQWAAH